jgi:hypothetical protein
MATDMLADDPAAQRAGILAKIRGSSLELLDMTRPLNVNRLDAARPTDLRAPVGACPSTASPATSPPPHQDGTPPSPRRRSPSRPTPKLRMVPKNQVGNALKFTPARSSSAASRPQVCAFTVRDTAWHRAGPIPGDLRHVPPG